MLLVKKTCWFVAKQYGTYSLSIGENRFARIKGCQRETFFNERLIEFGARTHYSFEEPWRFLAALFLHGNVPHLAMNMICLVLVAPWLGRVFGWFRGLVLYIGSGNLGNVLAQVMQLYLVPAADPETIVSVGASPPVRRRMASTRATNSSRENGFVT